MSQRATQDSTRRDIGARLKELRLARHISQEAMASYMGISAQHVSDIETGKKGTETFRLMRACDALGIALGTFYHPLHTPPPVPSGHTICDYVFRRDEGDPSIYAT